ncbi:WhiB family transcriptional regulator [Aquipuribacter hungaricus]|uniref:WhiB family transcriptional regulator n=1 Tax=Aquipuribacter hungaricus TaxID=545624 RepID=A0ABV7WKV9_9MICO
MTRGACTRRPDLPWTEDAHRVEDEIRAVMARVCTGCPVRERCRRYASDTFASAGFWAGGFRGGAYTGDLLDLLAELDTTELKEHYEPSARRARSVHRKALAS